MNLHDKTNLEVLAIMFRSMHDDQRSTWTARKSNYYNILISVGQHSNWKRATFGLAAYPFYYVHHCLFDSSAVLLHDFDSIN